MSTLSEQIQKFAKDGKFDVPESWMYLVELFYETALDCDLEPDYIWSQVDHIKCKNHYLDISLKPYQASDQDGVDWSVLDEASWNIQKLSTSLCQQCANKGYPHYGSGGYSPTGVFCDYHANIMYTESYYGMDDYWYG